MLQGHSLRPHHREVVGLLQRGRVPHTLQPQHAHLRAGRQPAQHLRLRPAAAGPHHPLLRRISRGGENGLHPVGPGREDDADATAPEGRADGRAPGHEGRAQGGGRRGGYHAGRPPILRRAAQDAAGREGEHQRRGPASRHARHLRHHAGHRHARHGRARIDPRQALAAQPHQLHRRRLRLGQGHASTPSWRPGSRR